MVAGQAIDLDSTDKQISFDQLKAMHKLKTGALIKAAVLMGAYCFDELNEKQESALSVYADNLGLAFQITDDILDVTSDTQTLGKPQGSDQEQNKSTYVSHLGLEGAKAKAELLIEQAMQSLSIFNSNQHLMNIAEFVLKRKY